MEAMYVAIPWWQAAVLGAVQGLTEQAMDQLDQGKRKISKMVGV